MTKDEGQIPSDNRLQLAASNVRCAPASGRGSPRVLGGSTMGASILAGQRVE
jgi:hypothetical protein